MEKEKRIPVIKVMTCKKKIIFQENEIEEVMKTVRQHIEGGNRNKITISVGSMLEEEFEELELG